MSATTVESAANVSEAVEAVNTRKGTAPDVSRAERRASFVAADFPTLTGREEEWRFTPLGRLRGLHTDTVASGTAATVSITGAGDASVSTVARDHAGLGTAGTPEERVAARAWESFAEANVVSIPANADLAEPISIHIDGQGGTEFAHTRIEAGQHSRAAVVLKFTGNATYADNVEIDVADGAQLTVVSIQEWDREAVHVSAHHARLGRDAKLTHAVITIGGDLVRVAPSARFAGTGGEVEMLGLYFTGEGQHAEHRLFVDHAQANCTSNVVYKGALQGDEAHSVWIGDVLIRAEAEGTDTYELNRNLLLTDGARADSVPNLEIETGQIEGAGHASATGRFDDEHLFYLQSRGIPEDEARRIVVRGFFAELLNRLKVPGLAEQLLESLDVQLESVAVAAAAQASEGADA